MSHTDVDLFRSLRVENFPDGIFQGEEPTPGVLYPDFYERKVGDKIRKADVDVFKDEHGIEWVRSGGGTSLFDKPNVFKKAGWLCFPIPLGTPIPESLHVVKQEFNKLFKATHYQIESRASLMTKQAMQGALDNFARAALARSVELAKKI